MSDAGSVEAALAAGHADAVAEQAAEEAEEATQTAEVAEMIAESASETAWDARAAVEDLRTFVTEQLQGLGAAIEQLGTPRTGTDDEAPKAPPKKAEKDVSTEEPAGESEPKKQTRSGYGSSWWFGKK